MSDLTKDVSKKQLVENLSNLAWDCASGWIDGEGVSNWSETQLRETSNNIIKSLTKPEGE
tara:strand:+ start:225 stop:404 length:180 start_codon:yes stop_codon:yes gene_type:complete